MVYLNFSCSESLLRSDGMVLNGVLAPPLGGMELNCVLAPPLDSIKIVGFDGRDNDYSCGQTTKLMTATHFGRKDFRNPDFSRQREYSTLMLVCKTLKPGHCFLEAHMELFLKIDDLVDPKNVVKELKLEPYQQLEIKENLRVTCSFLFLDDEIISVYTGKKNTSPKRP